MTFDVSTFSQPCQTISDWQPGDPLYDQATESVREARLMYALLLDHRPSCNCDTFDNDAPHFQFHDAARWPTPHRSHDLDLWDAVAGVTTE